MKATFYARYAARALYRNGQRSVLTIICIAFGVLSLVGLNLLATLLTDAFLIPPRTQLGGDAALIRGDRVLTTADAPALDTLRAEGLIGAYALVAPGHSILLRTERTGHVVFVSRALGVDPAVYPLVGSLELAAPAGGALSDVLAAAGDAVITQDLADRNDLAIGDYFTLTSGPGGTPGRLRVSGIVRRTPDRIGQTIYYNLDTARRLAGQAEAMANVAVVWGEDGDTGPRLEQAGWTVDRPPDEPDSAAAELIGFMLPGAGILGLLIAGIGVANTMQVVLARRTPEIATLKTLGYRQGDLLLLFGTETVFLGLLGSVVGVLGGLLLAHRLLALLQSNQVFMVDFAVDPGIVAGGVLTGVLVAVIFGMAAIVRASGVRPAVLLRKLRVRRTTRTRLATAGLYIVLLALFGVLSSVILGSVLQGFGVVAAGVAGLVVLGLLLVTMLLVTTRIPVPGLPLLGMARRNLRHRPLRSTSALVALFVGVFSIGFATAAIFNAQDRARARAGSLEGDNLLIVAGVADTARVTPRLNDPAVRAAHAGYQVTVQTRTTAGTPLSAVGALEGRAAADGAWNVALNEGTWPPNPREAFAPAFLRGDRYAVARGDTLVVTTPGGEARLRVAGFYEAAVQGTPGFRGPSPNLLVSRATALRLGGTSTSVTYTLQVDPPALGETTRRLGEALPQALLVNKADVMEVVNRTFRGIFFFVIAVAGLSFVAGAVLIANAVGLAMLERRRELGILKAIGFTSGNVLLTVLLENTILGVLSGLAGIAGVFVAMAAVNARFPDAGMTLAPVQALLIVAVAVALALGSATLVAWRPTHLRPLAVLRNE